MSDRNLESLLTFQSWLIDIVKRYCLEHKNRSFIFEEVIEKIKTQLQVFDEDALLEMMEEELTAMNHGSVSFPLFWAFLEAKKRLRNSSFLSKGNVVCFQRFFTSHVFRRAS